MERSQKRQPFNDTQFLAIHPNSNFDIAGDVDSDQDGLTDAVDDDDDNDGIPDNRKYKFRASHGY